MCLVLVEHNLLEWLFEELWNDKELISVLRVFKAISEGPQFPTGIKFCVLKHEPIEIGNLVNPWMTKKKKKNRV